MAIGSIEKAKKRCAGCDDLVQLTTTSEPEVVAHRHIHTTQEALKEDLSGGSELIQLFGRGCTNESKYVLQVL